MGWLYESQSSHPFASGGSLRVVAIVVLVFIVVALFIKLSRRHGSLRSKRRFHRKHGRSALSFHDLGYLRQRPTADGLFGPVSGRHSRSGIRTLLENLADSLENLSTEYGKSSMVKEWLHFVLQLIIDMCGAFFLMQLLSHYTGAAQDLVVDYIALIGFVAAEIDEIWSLDREAAYDHEVNIVFQSLFDQIKDVLSRKDISDDELHRAYNNAIQRRDQLLQRDRVA